MFTTLLALALLQTPAPAPVTYLIYAPGTTAVDATTVPLASFARPAATVTCGLSNPTGPSSSGLLDGSPLVLVWDDPSNAAMACESEDLGQLFTTSTLPACAVAPCASYPVYAAYTWPGVGQLISTTFVSVTRVVTTPPPPDRCAPPFGDRSISVFVTRLTVSTPGAKGSPATLYYQMGSPNSPITNIFVLVNGTAVTPPQNAQYLTGDGGIWFQSPTVAGTYQLAVQAVNAFGCSTTQTKDATGAAMTLTVK